ncbi:hypothetical protein, partial [Mesorhizobium sp. M4B.F.Ca.ET.150.01.1.1]|uniref:hypothetical protein n=1 Tax=Mesorhizobium sp. M4B.F.Ca.ET.150.01.1.1 TaxID=2563948 RepID=UPI001AEF151D
TLFRSPRHAQKALLTPQELAEWREFESSHAAVWESGGFCEVRMLDGASRLIVGPHCKPD